MDGAGEIKIEKGFILSTKRGIAPGINYPFASMEVGDSFFIPTTKETHTTTRNRCLTSVRDWKRFNRVPSTFAIATRSVEGGVRVWRIA